MIPWVERLIERCPVVSRLEFLYSECIRASVRFSVLIHERDTAETHLLHD